MEIFLDGGLFEMLIYFAFIACINFIFIRKYLLLLFSISAIACPLVVMFRPSGELFYILMSVCLVNAILMVLLLWKARQEKPNGKLFEGSMFKKPNRKNKSNQLLNTSRP